MLFSDTIRLGAKVTHVPSGGTFVVVGTTIDEQALIDYRGEGIIRGWVPFTDLEVKARRAKVTA